MLPTFQYFPPPLRQIRAREESPPPSTRSWLRTLTGCVNGLSVWHPNRMRVTPFSSRATFPSGCRLPAGNRFHEKKICRGGATFSLLRPGLLPLPLFTPLATHDALLGLAGLRVHKATVSPFPTDLKASSKDYGLFLGYFQLYAHFHLSVFVNAAID